MPETSRPRRDSRHTLHSASETRRTRGDSANDSRRSRSASRPRSTGNSAQHATRLATLPVPKLWIVFSINAALAVLLLGFAVTLIPGATPTELAVDKAASSADLPAFDVIARAVAVVFSPAGNILIVAALFAFLLFVRRQPVSAVAACFVISIGWLTTQAVKLVVARDRPALDALLAKTGDDSFPSGHTAFVTALVVGLVLLATRRRRLVAIVGAIGVLLVAATRVYGGAHYPTDVIGGMLTALTASLIAAGIWNAWGMRLLGQLTFLERFGPVRVPGDAYPVVHRQTLVIPRGKRR